jgi:hypothetical protein
MAAGGKPRTTAVKPPTLFSRALMASDTPSRAPAAQSQADNAPSQDALWAALSASSSRARPEARLLPSFPSGTAELVNDERANVRDLLCLRPGCGSVILRAGDAVLESAPSMQVRFRARSRGRRPHPRDVPARAGGRRSRTPDTDACITYIRGLVARRRRAHGV